MEKQRPYVILKWAESADGFMAPVTPGPYWLSTQRQNRLNHRWRTEEAAILVGSETYLQDSPTLTPRHYLGPAPQPIVLDRRNRLTNVPPHWLHLCCQTIPEVLHELYEAKLQSVIVEGGRKVLDAFIASGLYDEVRILRSPQTLGSGLPAPEIPPINPNRLIIVDP
jgi:diaminohydroxyphosphoribosylaminopyrimidine deaminase/5-amino-6-(5-phosphoribosylamino)uracil reductase